MGDDTDAEPGVPTVDAIEAAWTRELPGVPVGSIPVITTLWRVSKRLADERQRTLRRLHMDAATLDLLSTLRRAGRPYELTTRELAARSMVTAGAISQRIARAEAAGLIVRRPSAPDRSVTVALTDEGSRTLEPVVRALLAHENTLLSELGPDDRRTLVTLLDRLGSRASLDGDA